ncbi:MAG: 7-carboxy-7-deazaguanine synthase QueE [Elusimicrobiales bacterium]|nr:7-carboxy-7-deazaguanine synthase QueE [Elusimicrobiales bacterium]
MKNLKAPVYDMFSSYQGEGLFVGQKQIFLRFSGCNLSCLYCDENASREKGNIKDVSETVTKITKLSIKDHINVISFTGGEPLLYTDFIKKVIKDLGRDFNYLIETNGILYNNLKELIDLIDIVSMDIKFPQYSGKELWEEHTKFLRISKNKNVYVKVVAGSEIKISDFKKAVTIVSSVSSQIPFYIQPVTLNGNVLFDMDFIDKLYSIASSELGDVRFLPQIHKIIKIK